VNTFILPITVGRQWTKNNAAKICLTLCPVMGQKETVISELCKELDIPKPTLYRYLVPNGALRDHCKRVQ
jgi:hypothetical protein